MSYKLIAVASVLIVIVSAGFAGAQRGGEDTERPPEGEEAGPCNQPPSPTPAEEKPAELPAKSLGDAVQRDLAAWRHAKARQSLEAEKAKFKGTAYFDAAWALVLAQERQLDDALKALDTATKAEVKDPVAPYLAGEVQSWKGSSEASKKAWEEARKRAQAMVDAAPGDARARYWLGASLVRLGQFDAARTQLQKALEGGFDRAMAEYQIGLALTYQRSWAAARDAFTRCIEADSGFAHAYYYRGRVFKELGKTEEMLLDMDRFLKLAPDAREASAARSILNAGG